jgi:hypothetical protein
MTALHSARPRSFAIGFILLLALSTFFTGPAAFGSEAADDAASSEESSPGTAAAEDAEQDGPGNSPRSHSWPPTDPLDPNFVNRLINQGPPSGWLYHGMITVAGCVDMYYGASYFWRGSTSSLPTSVTSYADLDGNCLNTQFTSIRSRTTAQVTCLGLSTYSNTASTSGGSATLVTSQANATTSDLTCQPGSTMQFSMEARLTRPNGTFVYYCNKAVGVLGGQITESSSNTSPC